MKYLSNSPKHFSNTLEVLNLKSQASQVNLQDLIIFLKTPFLYYLSLNYVHLIYPSISLLVCLYQQTNLILGFQLFRLHIAMFSLKKASLMLFSYLIFSIRQTN